MTFDTPSLLVPVGLSTYGIRYAVYIRGRYRYGLSTGYVTHVTSDTRPGPLAFQRATLKNREGPGDEASLYPPQHCSDYLFIFDVVQ